MTNFAPKKELLQTTITMIALLPNLRTCHGKAVSSSLAHWMLRIRDAYHLGNNRRTLTHTGNGKNTHETHATASKRRWSWACWWADTARYCGWLSCGSWNFRSGRLGLEELGADHLAWQGSRTDMKHANQSTCAFTTVIYRNLETDVRLWA